VVWAVSLDGPHVFATLSWRAYLHVVRQHYGFLKLYKRKNHDGARSSARSTVCPDGHSVAEATAPPSVTRLVDSS
jgi:hypothetical protein